MIIFNILTGGLTLHFVPAFLFAFHVSVPVRDVLETINFFFLIYLGLRRCHETNFYLKKNENRFYETAHGNLEKLPGFSALIFAKDFLAVGKLSMKMITKERLMFLIRKG